jgi:hypothetical protein
MDGFLSARRLRRTVVAVGLASWFAAAHASGQPAVSYTVTVSVDEQTYEDFKALTDALLASPNAAIADSLYQHGTAAMADLVATAETRVDQVRWLTLDSGEIAELRSGDTVYVAGVRAGSASSDQLPLIAIHIGLGFATTLGRQDVIVPSGL